MFPACVHGRVEFPRLTGGDAASAIAGVARALEAEQARNVRHSGDTVTFVGRVFGYPHAASWSLLALVGKGSISAVPGSPFAVEYSASTIERLVMGSFGAAFMLAFGIIGPFPPAVAISVALAVWLALVGGSYLLAGRRLRTFVREAVNTRGSSVAACPRCGEPYDPSAVSPDSWGVCCASCGLMFPGMRGAARAGVVYEALKAA